MERKKARQLGKQLFHAEWLVGFLPSHCARVFAATVGLMLSLASTYPYCKSWCGAAVHWLFHTSNFPTTLPCFSKFHRPFRGLSAEHFCELQKPNMTENGLGHRERVLNVDTMNPNVKRIEYAVRGPVVQRAVQIEKELKEVHFHVYYWIEVCNNRSCCFHKQSF